MHGRIASLLALLALLGLTLSAVAAPGTRPAPPKHATALAGVAADWDDGLKRLEVAEVVMRGGRPAVRRALRRQGVVLLITGRTRLTVEYADGTRERIGRADLVDAMDEAPDDPEVEAAGTLVPGSLRRRSGPAMLTGRVLVRLPDDPVLEDDPGDLGDELDPGDEGDDPSFDDLPPDEGDPGDDPGDDEGEPEPDPDI